LADLELGSFLHRVFGNGAIAHAQEISEFFHVTKFPGVASFQMGKNEEWRRVALPLNQRCLPELRELRGSLHLK
jgi:hypothetical protein